MSRIRYVPRRLPRGAHAPERTVVLMSQRGRLIEGVVEAVAASGYAAVTVEDITRCARVSRTTFYEHFPSKEDCFLAAYEAGAHAHFEHVSAAVRRTEGWRAQLEEGIRAYLEVLAAEPAYARTFLLDVNQAGARAIAQRDKLHSRYAELLREWRQRTPGGDLGDIPDEFFTGAVAAMNAVVADHLRTDNPSALATLTPLLTRMVGSVLETEDGRDGPLARGRTEAPRRRDSRQRPRQRT